MLLRIASAVAIFASFAMAQTTLSLVSGNGQLVSYGTGTGSQPIVFSLMNGTTPVPNQTIAFTNSDGTPATSLVPESAVTNSAGLASVVFYPAFLNNSNMFQGFALQAHYGDSTVSFYETTAKSPQAVLAQPAAQLLNPLTAKAGQNGPQIEIIVESTTAFAIPNVAVRIIPVETGALVPPGTVVQTATCAGVGSTPEGNVFTNASGQAFCTPVFTYPNSALNPLYDVPEFKISVGDTLFYGPFPYSITPAPLTVSGPPPNSILLEGVASNLAITGTGGVPPYTFTLAPTSGLLPGGLTLETNGQIVGSSNTPGLYPFTVVLTDHIGETITSPGYSIAISAGAFADSPQSIPDAVVGQPYSQTISISGGVPPYSIALVGTPAPGLVATPSGLSIKISGTPTAASNVPLAIKVTDAIGSTDILSLFAFQTVLPLTISSVNTQVATVSSPLTFQVPISGGVPPYTITAAGLPTGLSIDPALGKIFGISTGAPGIYPVTVSITDSIGLTTTSTFNIDLSGGAIGLGGSPNLPSEQAGVSFSQPLTILGGVPPYTFTTVSNPDQTLAISSTGILTGTILAAGNQVIAFTVTDSAGQSVPLSITIPVLPVIAANGIGNSASFAVGSVAPGEIVSLFGSGLGPDQGVAGTVTGNILSTTDSGTTVMFGTFAAPILYASANQLNVVVPYEVAVGQDVAVTVTSNGQTSLPTNISVAQANPGIFIIGGTNSPSQAAVLNQDLSVNGPSNPAGAGTVIVIYATGGGTLSSPLADGELGGTPLVNIADVSLTVGGQPATISFAGVAPGFAGAIQVNATLPTGLAAGSAVPIVLTIGTATSSPQNATIAIQ